jgi:hypothetical protein
MAVPLRAGAPAGKPDVVSRRIFDDGAARQNRAMPYQILFSAIPMMRPSWPRNVCR